MIERLRSEWQALRAAVAGLSPNARRAAIVLLAATVLVLFHLQVGNRQFYRGTLGNALGFADPELGAWAWWFGMQGVLGFVVPAVYLLFVVVGALAVARRSDAATRAWLLVVLPCIHIGWGVGFIVGFLTRTSELTTHTGR